MNRPWSDRRLNLPWFKCAAEIRTRHLGVHIPTLKPVQLRVEASSTSSCEGRGAYKGRKGVGKNLASVYPLSKFVQHVSQSQAASQWLGIAGCLNGPQVKSHCVLEIRPLKRY